MKTKYFLLFFLLPLFAHAQLPVKDGKVFYEVVDTCSLTKEQLYNKTKLWLANTFNDSKSVIEVDDKENGEIVGKGNFTFYYRFMTNVFSRCAFTIRINLKDGSYRVQIYNLKGFAGTDEIPVDINDLNSHPNKTLSKKMLPGVDTGIKKTIESYKKSIAVDDNF